MKRKDAKAFLAEALDQLARHTFGPVESKSWYLSEPGKGSIHAYTVTWTKPGSLALAGDLGELTLVHTSAMPTWWDAVQWLGGESSRTVCDWSYHLSKSNAREEYDRDDTLRAIWHFCTEEAVNTLKGYRDERRDWRRALCAMNEPGSEDVFEDEIGPFWSDPPEPLRITTTPRFTTTNTQLFSWDKPRRLVPDGWERLDKLREIVADWIDENAIFTHEGRQQIKDELDGRLEDSHSAAELCARLGLDDYYGSYSYPRQRLWQMAAIYRWAKLVAGTTEYAEAKERARVQAEYRRQVLALDQKMPWDRHGEIYDYMPGVAPFIHARPAERCAA